MVLTPVIQAEIEEVKDVNEFPTERRGLRKHWGEVSMARLQISDIKTELSLKGWVLLSSDYQNLNTELEMLCP